MTFERHDLCAGLTPSEICLVVGQYERGVFIRAFHQHVPKSRLDDDARQSLLRALVMHFADRGPETIVRWHLNSKPGSPSADKGLNLTSVSPEPGVQRTYCGTDTQAWSDVVITSASFRGKERNGCLRS